MVSFLLKYPKEIRRICITLEFVVVSLFAFDKFVLIRTLHCVDKTAAILNYFFHICTTVQYEISEIYAFSQPIRIKIFFELMIIDNIKMSEKNNFID